MTSHLALLFLKVLEFNEESKYNTFLWFSGHVNWVSVDIRKPNKENLESFRLDLDLLSSQDLSFEIGKIISFMEKLTKEEKELPVQLELPMEGL